MRTADFARMRALREVRASEDGAAGPLVRYYDECTGELFDVDFRRGRFRRVLDLGADYGRWENLAST